MGRYKLEAQQYRMRCHSLEANLAQTMVTLGDSKTEEATEELGKSLRKCLREQQRLEADHVSQGLH